MPLVACPVCEKQISKRAHTCPGCGEPDPLNHLAKSKFISMVFWLLVLVGAGYAAWVYLLPMLIDFVRNQ
ncbi:MULTISPECIES: hypothetical protein [Vibrio]|jgi:predicted nucleic acid-binding Zn ribbon protein|uniref:DnrP protein n=1 Tax=Vibrio natriegens NBRC 15636 = ATCC 14048 = DSM 759 TaxID=1219067 RepID=A0AAN0Y1M7_VIBNA|nr:MULTISPECIES: hypothetical protein [Vibrio]MEE3880195.1 hypothetical protein [Vibrio sp. YYF0003]AEX21238.1 hypothetical protein VEJY3_03700 [Vibrio sp. EJY3]ALR16195.1 hypothetical protein PN96_09435 [Vibrio natriegens NBRC 15636 = ATCC 14048 = DSM 759]ANQ11943.1 hypothetical protein BA890_03910 [Vibrio natriegens NBRC 15636 = ATCC 14048 = DSM 759]ANQ16427.1 hypothetical protein BA891_04015 [Vibrio natriegens]